MIAAIQAGGRSLRMGEDKSWLMIDGRPMIENVFSVAQDVAEQLVIVIHPRNPSVARYRQLAANWRAELLFDSHDYRGPLGGIETALQHGDEKATVLVLACDLPFITADFLQLLREIHEAEKNQLTVPLDQQGRPQMLAAIYAVSCRTVISAMLAADELKTRLLSERVKTRRVRWEEYAHLPDAERLLININTPEALKQCSE